MIESTIAVRDEMVEINLEYAKEIEEFILLIQKQQGTDDKKSSIDKKENSVIVADEKMPSDSIKSEETTSEHQSVTNNEPINTHDDTTPPWAKSLWKKIALKCHPDRLNFTKLPSLELAKRQMLFSKARNACADQAWEKLLYYGIILDEYIGDLTMSEQYIMLEKQYNDAAAGVSNVQSSLAWKWGTDWKNIDMRIQIITVCCQSKNIIPPSRENLMSMLIKFESE